MTVARFKNIHEGKRCFILGSGPSIASQNLMPLKNEITLCSNWFINHNDYNSLDIKYYCAYDSAFVLPEINEQWRYAIKNMAAAKFFPSTWRGYDLGENVYFLSYDGSIKVYDSKNFSCDVERAVYDAGSVIINFCLPLAIYMGCTEIILLGVETNYGISNTGNPNQGYFYEAAKQLTPNIQTWESEQQWIHNMLVSYQVVSKYAQSTKIRIINCTPSGNLEVFERCSLESVLEKETT